MFKIWDLSSGLKQTKKAEDAKSKQKDRDYLVPLNTVPGTVTASVHFTNKKPDLKKARPYGHSLSPEEVLEAEGNSLLKKPVPSKKKNLSCIFNKLNMSGKAKSNLSEEQQQMKLRKK